MDWNQHRSFSRCDKRSKSRSSKCHKRCDGRSRSSGHRSDFNCCGKRRRNVIVECHKGNCNEVRRHRCCDHSNW